MSQAASEEGLSLDQVTQAIVVGNPTMLHLLLGVSPAGIGVSPYEPTFTESVAREAAEIGLSAIPQATVRTLPSVSGTIGADVIAGIIAMSLDSGADRTLFMDVGTNGEIVLAVGGRLVACSTAAGPAFEGASLVQGMTARPGAIASVSFLNDSIACDVIGGGPATGICGTGLMAAVAELRRAGVVDESGRIAAGATLADRIVGEGGERRIRLSDGDAPVYLHQKDVREFQLAKAALRTGIDTLLSHEGLVGSDLKRVLIAGGFSLGLSVEHLLDTGLLPQVDPQAVEFVGATAGEGAMRALLDTDVMDRADRVAERVQCINLASEPGFTERFVARIPFPGTA